MVMICRFFAGSRVFAISGMVEYIKCMSTEKTTREKQMPSSFQELIRSSEKPVLVDFYADWCGPCKMVSPAVERIASELKGRLVTVKVNIDKKQHVASQHSIQSIPTIMLFYQGRELMRLQGAYPYEQLKSQVERHLQEL